MKKIFSLIVASLILSVLVIGGSEAATKARTASYDKGIMQINGIGDLSTGDTVEISTNGSLQVDEPVKSMETEVGVW